MKRLGFLLLSFSVLVGPEAGPAAAKEESKAEERETASGFRMEGDPKIETVFGDSAQFKKYVDRFVAVFAEMQTTRDTFSRNVQAVLASLQAAKRAGGAQKCPTEAIALAYARGYKFGQRYHELGKELEANYVSIHELDALGETSGLTPDYRWRVSKALKQYQQVLRDFKEMKLAFQEELASELAVHKCDAAQLIATGAELEQQGADITVVADEKPVPKKDDKRKKKEVIATPVPATTITFFVDNSLCEPTLKVYVDGTLEGEIGSRAKAAFRTLVGRHDMCLIPATSKLSCGEQGSVRSTYLHDGWSIQLRCD